MPSRTANRGRHGREKPSDIEWVGGTVAVPAYITGEGEPYRPQALFWMGADGMILGSTVARPDQLLEMACDSLQSAIENPMVGRSHEPTRVRVASPELAQALRAGYPAVDIVCAPTPELGEVLAQLGEKMDHHATEPSYLSREIGPDAIASFFRAAAELFRAEPWNIVPADDSPLWVTIESLGLRDAVMSVIGQMGDSLGLVLFSGLADFHAFLDAADAIERGEDPDMPAHVSLNFQCGAELVASLREEIAEHRWEVAADDAYPWLLCVDEELVVRPPTAKEVTMAEAIALALPRALSEREALRAAWNRGEPVSRTISVQTHVGDLEVTLRVPCERTGAQYRPPHDVLGKLFELGRRDGMIDPEAREPLEDELVRRFAASPEASGLSDLYDCRLVMDYAAEYLGATIATLDSRQLREILFEIYPRKVSVDASKARSIIEVNRAFYGFLKREYGLEQADACLRVLGGKAVEKLEAALSDSRNFGIAKSLFMAGREAGFDVDTQEGLEAWLQVARGMPLMSLAGPPRRDPRPEAGHKKAAARAAKKNRRKAARKARKRSR